MLNYRAVNSFTFRQRFKLSPLVNIYVKPSLLLTGRKSGKGVFVYEPGVKDRNVNEGALNLLKKFSVEPKVIKE